MDFKIIKKIISLSIIGAALVFAVCEYARADYYQDQYIEEQQQAMQLQQALNAQNQAIDQWKAESDNLQKKVKAAELDSKRYRAESDKRLSAIMAEKVPHDCKKAIDWGIEKAKQL